jgi:hypothetical protein
LTDNRLLTFANAKTPKGEARGYLTGILYLVPSDGSGLGNLCPFASAGCRAACLYTAGRGVMRPIQEGRLRKTKLFFENAPRFVDMLAEDVKRLVRRAQKKNMLPAVRLNGTSDIPWERMRGTDGQTLMEKFPSVQFYDYTKRPARHKLPPNYHLTFSLSETNLVDAMTEHATGRNVAVVFPTRKGDPLPSTWHGLRVIDGDESDLRFLDEPRVIVGLRAKGRAKGEATGFVQLAA